MTDSEKALLVTSIVMVTQFLTGCAATTSDWEAISRLNNTFAYEAYLREHPTGEYAAIAERSIFNIRFKAAMEASYPRALQEFISAYPNEIRTMEVRNRLEEMSYEAIAPTGTISEYKNFLTTFPAGKYSEAAKTSISILEGQIKSIERALARAVTDNANTLVFIERKSFDQIAFVVGIHLLSGSNFNDPNSNVRGDYASPLGLYSFVLRRCVGVLWAISQGEGLPLNALIEVRIRHGVKNVADDTQRPRTIFSVSIPAADVYESGKNLTYPAEFFQGRWTVTANNILDLFFRN